MNDIFYLSNLIFFFKFYYFQQVNALDITPDKYLIAAAGYQHIRMYDLVSNNPNPIINYEGVSKNITGLGFQVFYNLFSVNINTATADN